MGFTGIIVGIVIGTLVAGRFGAFLGAALGFYIEWKAVHASRRRSADETHRRTKIFCGSAAAMLAKLAKSDGRVSENEIAAVERTFNLLRIQDDLREYAIQVFRQAKDDSHTIYEYAADFASVIPSAEVRMYFYELLWDLACADGRLSRTELDILQRITASLRVDSGLFNYYYRMAASGGGARRGRPAPQPSRDPLADAYRTLGVSPSAGNAEIKKAYRDLAKKNHPDLLRAQGLPEGMIGRATEKMVRINEAWQRIREARGI